MPKNHFNKLIYFFYLTIFIRNRNHNVPDLFIYNFYHIFLKFLNFFNKLFLIKKHYNFLEFKYLIYFLHFHTNKFFLISI